MQDTLEKYLPEKGGRFKYGTYKGKRCSPKDCKFRGLPVMEIIGGCPMGLIKITVNATLNKYRFLITFGP